MFEELKLKLGLDNKEFETGLRGAKDKILGFFGSVRDQIRETAHAGGKGFKKVLAEISESSPLLGAAMKLVLNPIVGTFAAAVVAFKSVKEAIADLDQLLNRVAAANAKSLGDFTGAIKKARQELKAEREQFAAMVKDFQDPTKEVPKVISGREKEIADRYAIERKKLQLEREEVMSRASAADKGNVSLAYDKRGRELDARELRERNTEQEKWLRLVEQARKKVAGDVLAYEAGGEGRARRKLAAVNTADELKSLLSENEAIVKERAGLYQQYAAAGTGSGLGRLVNWIRFRWGNASKAFAYAGGGESVLSLELKKYEEAEQMIAAIKRLSPRMEAGAEAAMEKLRTEQQAQNDRIASLKQLDAMYDQMRGGIGANNAAISQMGLMPYVYKSPPVNVPFWQNPMLQPIDKQSASEATLKALLMAATQEGLKIKLED